MNNWKAQQADSNAARQVWQHWHKNNHPLLGALPHTHTGTQRSANISTCRCRQSSAATATLPVTQLSFGRERVQARHCLVRCCCLRCVYPSLTSSSSSLTSRCSCVYVCARLRLSVRCVCCCFLYFLLLYFFGDG